MDWIVYKNGTDTGKKYLFKYVWGANKIDTLEITAGRNDFSVGDSIKIDLSYDNTNYFTLFDGRVYSMEKGEKGMVVFKCFSGEGNLLHKYIVKNFDGYTNLGVVDFLVNDILGSAYSVYSYTGSNSLEMITKRGYAWGVICECFNADERHAVWKDKTLYGYKLGRILGSEAETFWEFIEGSNCIVIEYNVNEDNIANEVVVVGKKERRKYSETITLPAGSDTITLKYPVSGSIEVYLDSVFVEPSDYSVDEVQGIVRFNTTYTVDKTVDVKYDISTTKRVVVSDESSKSEYGVRTKILKYPNINDENELYNIGRQYISANSYPKVVAKILLTDFTTDVYPTDRVKIIRVDGDVVEGYVSEVIIENGKKYVVVGSRETWVDKLMKMREEKEKDDVGYEPLSKIYGNNALFNMSFIGIDYGCKYDNVNYMTVSGSFNSVDGWYPLITKVTSYTSPYWNSALLIDKVNNWFYSTAGQVTDQDICDVDIFFHSSISGVPGTGTYQRTDVFAVYMEYKFYGSGSVSCGVESSTGDLEFGVYCTTDANGDADYIYSNIMGFTNQISANLVTNEVVLVRIYMKYTYDIVEDSANPGNYTHTLTAETVSSVKVGANAWEDNSFTDTSSSYTTVYDPVSTNYPELNKIRMDIEYWYSLLVMKPEGDLNNNPINPIDTSTTPYSTDPSYVLDNAIIYYHVDGLG